VRVLIADDAPAVRQRVARLLGDAEVVEVVGHSGDVASTLSAIRDLEPDVVILDLRMPGGSGLDVLEALRQRERRPAVIVLTNYPFPQYRRRCLDAGASFFLDKATEFDQLLQALEQLAHSAGTSGLVPPPTA
jgi:DNA-binding NarL/FixJ family response regulator